MSCCLPIVGPGTHGPTRVGCLPFLCLFSFILAFCLCAPAQEAPVPKNVLVLESFTDRVLDSVEPLKSELRSQAAWPVNFYVEYLDGYRFDDKGYQEGVVRTLRHMYVSRRLDLVMVHYYPALQFILRHRDELFPGVPIVFWGVHIRRLPAHVVWQGVTGVTETDQVGVTIDLALHLHPNADTVAVITGNSEFDKYWLAVVHAEVFRHRDKVREIDLVGLPTSQLLDSVAALSPQTVVLFQEYASGSIQSAMVVRDILAWVGQRLPTYCVFPDVCVSGGGIGGVGRDPKEQYLLAAQLARRVLAGERPESIRVMNGVAYQVGVDWRQVHHWKIPESSLPPNTLVLYRPEPLWQRYRWQLELAIVFLLGLILLGVYLLVERARRRRAEAIVTRQLSFETLSFRSRPSGPGRSSPEFLYRILRRKWHDGAV